MSQPATNLRRIQLVVAHLVLTAGLVAAGLAASAADSGSTIAHGNKHLGKGNKHNMIDCGAFGWDGESTCI
jgi:hypothetical protein